VLLDQPLAHFGNFGALQSSASLPLDAATLDAEALDAAALDAAEEPSSTEESKSLIRLQAGVEKDDVAI
jgi:hypothetical protein